MTRAEHLNPGLQYTDATSYIVLWKKPLAGTSTQIPCSPVQGYPCLRQSIPFPLPKTVTTVGVRVFIFLLSGLFCCLGVSGVIFCCCLGGGVFFFCCLGGGPGPAQTAKKKTRPRPNSKNDNTPPPLPSFFFLLFGREGGGGVGRVFFCCLGGGSCSLFCCLGGVVLFFCCLGGGVLFFSLFGPVACFFFLCCLGGGREFTHLPVCLARL